MGLLNVDSYYNSLLSFTDKAVDEGFITTAARHIIVSAPTADDLVRKLEVSGYTTLICRTNIMHGIPIICTHGKREKGQGRSGTVNN